jgi:hypothetical protein
MSMRVNNQISTHLDNNLGLNTSQGSESAKPLGEQVQQSLFSRPRPALLEAAAFPEIMAILAVLNRYRRKLAFLAGDEDKDYGLALADDTIAAIDEHGTIFMGAAFLMGNARNMDLLVGVLAHEIGHRPKRWRELRYQIPKELSRPELDALCRHEEIRADFFAGRGLAELGMRWEPLVQFLEFVQVRPHPEYLPAKERSQVVQDGYMRRDYRLKARSKLFPEYHRFYSPDGFIGDF